MLLETHRISLRLSHCAHEQPALDGTLLAALQLSDGGLRKRAVELRAKSDGCALECGGARALKLQLLLHAADGRVFWLRSLLWDGARRCGGGRGGGFFGDGCSIRLALSRFTDGIELHRRRRRLLLRISRLRPLEYVLTKLLRCAEPRHHREAARFRAPTAATAARLELEHLGLGELVQLGLEEDDLLLRGVGLCSLLLEPLEFTDAVALLRQLCLEPVDLSALVASSQLAHFLLERERLHFDELSSERRD